jgi:hypothetical protein
MRWLAFFVVALALLLWALSFLRAVAKDAPQLFDKPAEVVKIPLARDPLNPQAKPMLSCFYFGGFAVKQIDRGEVGAERLSILPIAAGEKPACAEAQAGGEIVIDSAEWSGYFKGAKGDYVFFDAADGWNGGLGFAIFTASGKKVLEDVAKGILMLKPMESGIALKYRRVYGAKCSLFADATGCWAAIRKETGLVQPTPPDCSAAYKREQKRTPASASQIAADPTVIYYEVETVVAAGAGRSSAAPGKVSCEPAI